jgi:hypothetical protein
MLRIKIAAGAIVILDPDLDFLYGRYDPNNSQWTYADWSMVKDYWAEILDPLATVDAQTHEAYFFIKQLRLN